MNLFYIFYISLYLSLSAYCQETVITDEKILVKFNKLSKETEAIKVLNDCIYNNFKITNFEILRLAYQRKWLKASRLMIGFLIDLSSKQAQEEVSHFISFAQNSMLEMRSYLAEKKKNIVRISPIFEWSQDNEKVKIRIKFAKNLESPGEKDIQNFKVNCTRAHLEVQGYKVNEDYVAYYYRDIHLYEFIRPATCTGYKETDGAYIIKFDKNQFTLYWNFLDQPTADHTNMYTWFEVFTAYDGKARYTDFREWTQENLLISDIEDYVNDKGEEKSVRLRRIDNFHTYLRTQGFENKNYCNSPVNEKFCLLSNIHDWNYWLA